MALGFLDDERLDADQIKTLADLPSLASCRPSFWARFRHRPASWSDVVEPGSSLARVVRAKFAEVGEFLTNFRPGECGRKSNKSNSSVRGLRT